MLHVPIRPPRRPLGVGLSLLCPLKGPRCTLAPGPGEPSDHTGADHPPVHLPGRLRPQGPSRAEESQLKGWGQAPAGQLHRGLSSHDPHPQGQRGPVAALSLLPRLPTPSRQGLLPMCIPPCPAQRPQGTKGISVREHPVLHGSPVLAGCGQATATPTPNRCEQARGVQGLQGPAA